MRGQFMLHRPSNLDVTKTSIPLFRQMALSPPAALDAAFTTPTNARHAPATSGLLVTYSAELTREVRKPPPPSCLRRSRSALIQMAPLQSSGATSQALLAHIEKRILSYSRDLLKRWMAVHERAHGAGSWAAAGGPSLKAGTGSADRGRHPGGRGGTAERPSGEGKQRQPAERSEGKGERTERRGRGETKSGESEGEPSVRDGEGDRGGSGESPP